MGQVPRDHVLANFRPSLKDRAKKHVSAQERREGNSKDHLELIRRLPSCVSGVAGPCDPHHLRAQAAGLDQNLSIVPATLAKGLELDDVIVVEPTAIVADDAQGLRLLYVTLTRSTRSLTVVHRMPLPDAML